MSARIDVGKPWDPALATSPGSPGLAPVTTTAVALTGIDRPLLSATVSVVLSGKTAWVRSLRSWAGLAWIVVPAAGFDPTSWAWALAEAARQTEATTSASRAPRTAAARRRQWAATGYSTGKSASS